MMKQEFEQMVGKEVTVETFEMYEAMYMALPESVNKQQFVAMLNIAAIPESEEAIARRESAERRRKAILEEIDELKQEWSNLAERRKLWATRADDFEKNEYKWLGIRIERVKSRIRELKFFL